MPEVAHASVREAAGPEPAARRQAVEPGAAPELGNQIVQGLFDRGLRPKLEVGGADDPEERQADALADRVLNGPGAAPCACGGSCPSCGGGKGKIRRSAEAGASASAGAAAGFGNRTGLPLGLAARRHFEPRFGADFGAVRIHDDPATHRLARGIGARAFAIGGDIGFAESRYRPESAAGRALLAHELAHVALGHGKVRRITDEALEAAAERHLKRSEAEEAALKHHQAWGAAVDKKFGADLGGQSKSVGEEKERVGFAVLAQRVAALDAAAGGEGWLNAALAEQGYAGPDLASVRQAWGEAVIAAEGLALAKDGPDSDAKLAALETIPTFYDDLATFASATELAHLTRYGKALKAAKEDYQRKLSAYETMKAHDKRSYGPAGEPGEGASRGMTAVMHGSPPVMAVVPDPPKPISLGIPAARERIYAADTPAQWSAVTGDVRSLGAGLSKLVVSTLPETSEARVNVEYVEKLEEDLTKFENEHPLSWRVPATFYPLDTMEAKKDAEGADVEMPKSVNWQFYLTNTGVTSHDQPATSGGQWVLHDLTSGRGFKNTAPASDMDLAKLQQGDLVDPPIELFSELNSAIRFPEGRLYFTLPSGTSYVLTTTAPISLSDFLAGFGLVLAAVAITAGVIATGGAAAPAAIAFYAGLGAAAAGIGSTLADMHEKDVQGILTNQDVDKAMVSIGIDVVSALTMGLGRMVSAPGAAARFGARFVILTRITKVAQAANLAADVYQGLTATEGFVQAFSALDRLPEDQRDKARAQLVRRALLTGALMTIALKGDIADIRAAPGFHMDADGAFVPHGKGETPGVEPHPHGDVGSAPARAGAHADVGGPTHAASQRAGADMAIGGYSHSVGAAGKGPTRDFYFCSDLCGPIVDKLKAAIAALPPDHPELEMFRSVLNDARKARRDLKAGKLTDAEADLIAKRISDDINRLSNHSRHFGPMMNTDTGVLQARRKEIQAALAKDLGDAAELLGDQAGRQVPSRAAKRSTALDDINARSAGEIDLMAGMDMQMVDRVNKRLQKIKFDAGNFSHAHGEALVPGLPKGMSAEVQVTMLDGTVGRADRVRFITDAEGNTIGAHVYEIKPNSPYWVEKGKAQAQGYADGLRAKIEADLRKAGKPIPTTAPDGGPLYPTSVVTYDQQQMIAVMRAVRQRPADAAKMAEYEALARAVFAAAPK